MESYVSIIIGRVIIMSIIMAIGAFAYKRNIITKDGTKQLSSLELSIVNPLLIFMSYQSDFDSGKIKGLMWTFLLSVLSFAIVIPAASFIKKKGEPDYSAERFTCIYSNCGFMGIPLISALFGDEGVLYLTGYITVFNLLVFTHGYMLMKERTDFSAFMKGVKSPAVIAAVIGFICYVSGIRIPSLISDAAVFIKEMNTPLAMLIAGATAAQSGIIKAFADRKLMTTAAAKLIVLPLIVIAVMSVLPDGIPSMSKTIVGIACACPAATTGTLFALLFDKNVKRCSELFAVTTIISMVTLPAITAVIELLI